MQILTSSFRDPGGFVFYHNEQVYRFIHNNYTSTYDKLMQSGLYEELTQKGWLIPHEEVVLNIDKEKDGRIILPQQVPVISYPYEWSFAMWQDAAIVTLQTAITSLKKDMLLKDATPFNIQFVNGKPVLIDTLSFENYREGSPWVAYHQFCKSFLAPLLLMHYCHPDTHKLFTVYPNGIPLDVLVTLLPKRSRWNLNCYLHIYLQAKFAKKQKGTSSHTANFSRRKMEILLQGLLDFIRKLSLKKVKTTWDDYYTDTILSTAYAHAKAQLVQGFLKDIDFTSVVDLGANDGYFSLLFDKSKRVTAIDGDANCINELYKILRNDKVENILPLVVDLSAPSPAIGWNNEERDAIGKRLKGDVVLALALVHHLAISNSIPLSLIAGQLQQMGTYLVIEFIPKTDEKVKLLLQNREDVFDEYTLDNFKKCFSRTHNILKEEEVANTGRVLFLMKRI